MAAKDANRMRTAIETLCANIAFAEVDRPIRTIAVTSSLPREGKTTVSVELARYLAESGRRTLLVECDLRRRSLSARLGLAAAPRAGLCAAMLDAAGVEGVAVPTAQEGLALLDAEPSAAMMASDVLGSRRFKAFAAELGRVWEYAIFDTPPLDVVVDAAFVGAAVDATLLVVRDGAVERAKLVAAHDQLRKAGANVIGVVMNCCEDLSSDAYERYR